MLKKDKQEFIKMLIYKSNYMGCRENDIIFGRFASNNLHNMPDNKLLLYRDLLAENDANLFTWVTSQSPVPKKYSALIEKIIDYQLKF